MDVTVYPGRFLPFATAGLHGSQPEPSVNPPLSPSWPPPPWDYIPNPPGQVPVPCYNQDMRSIYKPTGITLCPSPDAVSIDPLASLRGSSGQMSAIPMQDGALYPRSAVSGTQCRGTIPARPVFAQYAKTEKKILSFLKSNPQLYLTLPFEIPP